MPPKKKKMKDYNKEDIKRWAAKHREGLRGDQIKEITDEQIKSWAKKHRDETDRIAVAADKRILDDRKAADLVKNLGKLEEKLTSKAIADKSKAIADKKKIYTLAYQATQLDAQNNPNAINKYRETYELMINHPDYKTDTQFKEKAEEYKSRSIALIRLYTLPQSVSTSQARGAVGGKKYRKRKVKKSSRRKSKRKSRRKSSRRKSRRKSSRRK
tara:strand:- start:4 stop:645 length:642 start_codon:yes stop_codon:yes gene_type:complete